MFEMMFTFMIQMAPQKELAPKPPVEIHQSVEQNASRINLPDSVRLATK